MVDKELIENWRNMVKLLISSLLFKTNYEGMGEQDKEEFERDFDEILDLALIGLKHKEQFSQEGTAKGATTDTISRQAAIDALHMHLMYRMGTDSNKKRLDEWINNLPSAQPVATDTNVGDITSRQQAIDALMERFKRVPTNAIIAKGVIENLPSAQPERKKGKWIYNSPVTMKCDQCGLVIKDWDWHRFKFCPNCDCDMRGEQK